MILRSGLSSSKRWRPNLAVVFVLIGFGSAACAEATGAESSSVEVGGAGEEFRPDYDNPLGVLGREVTDATTSALPFVPKRLPTVDATFRQYVYTPDDPSAAMAAFVYENEMWGQVVVLEYSDTMTPEGLLAEADQQGGGCTPVPEHGDDALSCSWDPFDVVDLGDTKAIVADGEELTSLMWVADLKPALGYSSADFKPNNFITVEVMGDASTLSMAEIVDLGKLLVADS